MSITSVNHSAVSSVRASRTNAGHVAVAAGGNAAIATAYVAAPRVGAPRKAVKDMTVQERFASLKQRFVPEKAKNVDVKFQFNITGSGGGKWYVVIKKGTITVKEGTGPSPTATLKANSEDYLKIANGEMNKMLAYIRGKLKIEGDKDALKEFDSYFRS